MTIDVDLNLAVEDKNIDIITSLQYYVIPAKAGIWIIKPLDSRFRGNDDKYIVIENIQAVYIIRNPENHNCDSIGMMRMKPTPMRRQILV